MMNSSHRLAIRSFLVGLCLTLCAVSQSDAQRLLPLAGTHFTFAVIEGPDSLGSANEVLTSELLLSVVSDHAGCGFVESPQGYKQSFSYDSVGVTRVVLDHDLMLLSDLGKTNKGLLVTTSTPVTLNLHDFAPQAGDATQLLPDDALDTAYVVGAWGIYNDPGENNHSQFVVTSMTDATTVTITPSVRTLLGQPAGVPFTVQLDRGECYIVKADASDNPQSTSLVESTVSASAPVSVITGVSCAYVPLGLESCNEIMDELIPRSAWGTEFYARNLTPFNDEDILFVTSDVKSYYVIVAGGITYFTSNGHLTIPFSRASHFTASVPVQCHVLSEGSSTVGFNSASDPSMVTLLPINQFRDTLLWATPRYQFADHYINLIYPTAIQSQVLLDGNPIGFLGVIEPIPFSTMSTASIGIQSGRHMVTAPQPIFGIATGFDDADAYTIMAGSIAKAPAPLQARAKLSGYLVPVDSEVYCHDFRVNFKTDSAYFSDENIASIDCEVNFDPTKLLLLGLQKLAATPGIIVTVDSTRKADIRIHIVSKSDAPLRLMTGDLFGLKFLAIDKSIQQTEVTFNCTSNSIFPCLSSIAVVDSLSVQPVSIADTMRIPIQIVAGSAVLGKVDTASVSVGAIDASLNVRSFDLDLVYDHDILACFQADLTGSLLNGWTASLPVSIDKMTDRITFTTTGAPLVGPGLVAKLFFTSYVSDSGTALIKATTSFSNTRLCPLVLSGTEATGLFLGKDLCGDPELHQMMGVNGLRITSIIPNPSGGRVAVAFTIPQSERAHISVVDLLGREVWRSDELQLGKGENTDQIDVGKLAAGRYVLSVSSEHGVTSGIIEVVH